MANTGNKFVRPIGHGGYSLVYHVKSPRGSTDLAMKINFTDTNLTGSGSYAELQINIELDHEYIMRIRDIKEGNVIEQEGITYPAHNYQMMKPDTLHFFYPLAKGDLNTLLNIHSSEMDFATAANICLQVSLAIEYMHAKNYIHRDIKPANILISENEQGLWICKICDFGLTKYYLKYDCHSPAITTAYYRAPEVVLGCPDYDKGVDVWAVGCVFYEVMTGEKLFMIPCDNHDLLLKEMLNKLPYQIPLDYVREINPSRVSILSGLSKANANNFIKFLPRISKEISLDGSAYFRKVLLGMLKFNHRERLTMKQVVDSEFFYPMRATIEKKRKDHPPVENPYPVTPTISKSEERTHMKNIAKQLFSERYLYKWYSHKVFFLSVYNFDRMLSTAKLTAPFSYDDCLLYFSAMMYLSLKIHNKSQNFSLFDVIPTTMRTERNLHKAGIFEKFLVRDVLKYKINYMTIYDVALTKSKVDDNQAKSMLNFILLEEHQNLTPREAYEKWSKSKLTYELGFKVL